MIAEGLKTSDKVRKLQRSLYGASKEDPRRQFYSLYDKICREDVLRKAFRRARGNGGAGGLDGQTWEDTNEDDCVKELLEKLKMKEYKPQPIRRVWIPKSNGKKRPLGIGTVKDRVVQTAIKIVIEPIFEAHFYEHSYGFRPKRGAHQMIYRVGRLLNSGYKHVYDLDIKGFFDNVNHAMLMKMLARRMKDGTMLDLIRRFMKVPIKDGNNWESSDKGCPQGSPLSPLLANIYLCALDFSFLKYTRFKDCVLLRYCDDCIVVSRDSPAKAQRLSAKVLGHLKLELNQEKTGTVNMDTPGGRFNILGFTFLRASTQKLILTPTKENINEYRRKLRDIINRKNPATMQKIVHEASDVCRGWANYFSPVPGRKVFVDLSKFTFMRMRKLLLRRAKCRSWRRRKYSFKWIHRNLKFDGPYVAWAKARSLI